jgi:glycosyltransferase involved in cell wall biosynthesis
VSDADLPELYAAARVFAYPSLYEGFGIPPLEAMACGTPVVASNAGALPEVLGDAALLVDPRDEAALAEALRAAADDRGSLRRRGLERAARYRWDRAATETWRVYDEAVAAG